MYIIALVLAYVVIIKSDFCLFYIQEIMYFVSEANKFIRLVITCGACEVKYQGSEAKWSAEELRNDRNKLK